MKQTEIDRILEYGSTREKIKLYFTDAAHFNTLGEYTPTLVGKENDPLQQRKEHFLTDEQREYIKSLVKERRDIKYYENLRIWNRAFLFFKDRLAHEITITKAISQRIGSEVMRLNIINNLLELYPDKNSRETALQVLKGAKQYEEKASIEEIKKDLAKVNTLALSCKEYLVVFSYVCIKELPLKPYKDWVRDQQKELKAILLYCSKFSIEDSPKIIPYQDIFVELEDEDLEAFYFTGT